MRRIVLAIALAAALAVPGIARAAAPTGAGAITVTRQQQLDPRLREYGLRTSALADETNLRVLLPDGYDADPSRRYPVLYLLNGCCDYDVDGSQAWTTHGDAEQLTAGLPMIVVMPAGGRGGFYSDWYHGGAGGPPEWETYHVGELIPWVDSHFHTVADRTGRAIAGLSMGGFGAMSYAARHPDLFGEAAAFSGAVDIGDPEVGPADDELAGLDGGAPGDIWGVRDTEFVRWRAHNPVDLAENLRGLRLTLRTGNGQPGGDYGGGPDPLEMAVHQQEATLHERLTALGLPHVWDDYGPGAHQWPYWARDLKETLPQITDAFAHPPPAPDSVTFTAVEPDYTAYGWRVHLDRAVLELSRLEHASARGFALAGSGAADVITPPAYTAGGEAEVTSDGRDGVRTDTVAADGSGRLHLHVPLGPANTAQQDAPGAQTTVFHTTVRIAAHGESRAATGTARACTSRRVVVLRLPRGLRGVRATVSGRRATVRGGRLRVDLRGRSPGAVRVVVHGRLRDGRRYQRNSTLHPCARAGARA